MKRLITSLGFLLLVGLFIRSTGLVIAADKQQFTIPTRTSTPAVTNTPIGGDEDPTNPPPPPTSDNPPGDDNPPPATNTPAPSATTTPGVTLVATPEGGFLPTAAPCSPQPTVQALGRVNVRSGPGPGYTLLSQLSYLEVRLITGRAQYAAWWQIELADGSLGWVSNDFVLVSGYIGLVPIVAPPNLPGGATPVPGPLWNPTPNPVCTPLPTSTVTDTPPPTFTAAPVQGEGDRGGNGAIPLATEPETATPTPEPVALDREGSAAEPPPAIPVVPTAVPEPVLVGGAAPLDAPAEAAGVTSESDPAGNLSLGWLPLVGVGLIAAGTMVLLLRRR